MTTILCARWIWACWPSSRPAGRGDAGRFTYSASLSYKTPWGLVPYVTSAKSAAMEIGQASEVLTSLLAGRDWLSNSFLDEVGVKFTALDDHLLGSLDWYVQNRTQLKPGCRGITSVTGTVARGRRSWNCAMSRPPISA